ncbi:hypothetical protein PYCCODRAFT_451469 [Trametes coccinea BRFM310]|uniref:Uncharacterized protein n=1 Tax=Trametes coccinea (strain BRFM310) TaxID=1353009 RepID=A0A1Y2IL37_TRAC3|nr:hypothetical protein PYCCODRAFT_451469 [Trametes coccinea BRFM310]
MLVRDADRDAALPACGYSNTRPPRGPSSFSLSSSSTDAPRPTHDAVLSPAAPSSTSLPPVPFLSIGLLTHLSLRHQLPFSPILSRTPPFTSFLDPLIHAAPVPLPPPPPPPPRLPYAIPVHPSPSLLTSYLRCRSRLPLSALRPRPLPLSEFCLLPPRLPRLDSTPIHLSDLSSPRPIPAPPLPLSSLPLPPPPSKSGIHLSSSLPTIHFLSHSLSSSPRALPRSSALALPLAARLLPPVSLPRPLLGPCTPPPQGVLVFNSVSSLLSRSSLPLSHLSLACGSGAQTALARPPSLPSARLISRLASLVPLFSQLSLPVPHCRNCTLSRASSPRRPRCSSV